MKTAISSGLVLATALAIGLSAISFVTAQDTDPKVKDHETKDSSYQGKDGARYLDANFKKALSASNISLAQAIATAESQAKGKCVEAKICYGNPNLKANNPTPSNGTAADSTSNDNALFIEACVLANEKLMKVTVDQTGRVLSINEKKGDATDSKHGKQ